MSEESKPIGGEFLTTPFKVLAGFALFAGILVLIRYIMGIGAVSNMSDGYPWGIWIAYDVVAGTAIACGGYSMAILVYVLNKRPVSSADPAGAPGQRVRLHACCHIDLHRYWHGTGRAGITCSGQIFECEFGHARGRGLHRVVCDGPVDRVCAGVLRGYSKEQKQSTGIFDKMGRNWRSKDMEQVPVLLHSSWHPAPDDASVTGIFDARSLGKKLSPLWQTGFLPLLFLISAITMGYAIVIFESLFSSVGLRRPTETPYLSKLSGIMPWLTWDLSISDPRPDRSGRSWESLCVQCAEPVFWIENALVVYPLVILMSAQNRTKARPLFLSALSILLAGLVYRFNAFLVGFDPGNGWHYFPSFSEIMITFGIISFEIMAYLYIVKKFPVLPKAEHA